ncbi:dTDP-glucose 4,6-dehydratase [Ferroacidibacillus organovorans]|uniref:dTDP-glucose 4,6-dehydratase n=1 Tax=Ferroacidibacillus organovorans TaxID=1765683 RepID=A0A101XNX0_9BACL|nr:dTDP-glucose 4,6-dehydratase [Ferroacidibacillus organovorans]KUO94904.1 dTDP-glucose 4,6-dehydratase [Ferroacidibacillus organovorans]
MVSRLLVTGGAGFIGCHFIRMMLETHSDLHIVNLDALTYAANREALRSFDGHPRYTFVQGDITDAVLVDRLMQQVDGVVNFAAESHVDRSIADPGIFVKTNVLGTQVLLDAARQHGVKRYLQVSTDEVYGTLGAKGYFTEETPLAANSPYSASKAGADLMVRAYHETFGLPTLITRCSNNYGPYQHDEKLIPTLIRKALRDEPLPIYGDGLNVRDWLFVEDHCRAIDLVLREGTVGQVYNVGGHNEWKNIEIARLILKTLGKPETLISYVDDRLGHDRRYAIDAKKMQDVFGWVPDVTFEQGILSTIAWYVEHYATSSARSDER